MMFIKIQRAEKFATYVDQDTIYKECDVISLHMPLFDSTYHIINHETIAKMKDGVILQLTAQEADCD